MQRMHLGGKATAFANKKTDVIHPFFVLKEKRTAMPFFIYSFNQTARTTLPERRQREHTEIVLGEPLTIALTVLTLAFQVLLLLL